VIRRIVFGLACSVALTATVSQAASLPLQHLAPADMYFGRMKLSFIGINNTFQHAAIEAGPHTTSSSIANKIDFAMESLNEWQGRYPRDPHLARSYFLGELTLKKIWVKRYQDKAWAYMQQLVTAYPTTFFGKTVKTELGIGFTQHYYAEPVPARRSRLRPRAGSRRSRATGSTRSASSPCHANPSNRPPSR